MDSNPIVGANVLTALIGVPLCIFGAIAGGGAGCLSALIFTIAFYQFVMAMAAGGPSLGMCALLVLAFEILVMFCICAIFFGQEVTLQAASYWKEPIAWGGVGIDTLWDGIWEGDMQKKWIGLFHICFGSCILLGIWYLIHYLGRVGN